MTASSSPELDYQVNSKYTLKIRQQPLKARLCSFKDKVDRRPLDPPPIVQLITDAVDESNYSKYFLYATLASKDDSEDITFLDNSRTTAGDVVQSLYRLRDINNNDGVFFIFSDISIRMEGFFRLRFTLFEIIGSYAQSKSSVLSDVFQVYSPKSFPGMSESTFLTRLFSEQGVRVRIRKETRSSPSSPASKRKRSSTDSTHLLYSENNDHGSKNYSNKNDDNDFHYDNKVTFKEYENDKFSNKKYQQYHKEEGYEENRYALSSSSPPTSPSSSNMKSAQSIMSMKNILLSPRQTSPKINTNPYQYFQS
ncbi:unnamed protein product [Cunninghamella blakesleeana]